jgi:hypothetical protein
MYEFKPPSILENVLSYNRLMVRYLTPQGLTVAKEFGGGFVEMHDIASDEFELYEKVYLGGYIHIVTDEEASELESAGYEVTAL